MWISISLTFILTVIVLLGQPLALYAIDIESTKESKCFEIKKTAPMDESWMATIKSFYYPLMSRYDLYNSGVGISGKNSKDLQEDELYYDSCITFSEAEGGFLDKGFGGKEVYFSVKSLQGSEVYEFSSDVDDGFRLGTCYNTLTDNKTFAFAACCANNDQMSWGVMSSQKQLPIPIVKQIYDHAESLGFKREHFTALRYDSCDLPSSSSSSTCLFICHFNFLLPCLLFLYVLKLDLCFF